MEFLFGIRKKGIAPYPVLAHGVSSEYVLSSVFVKNTGVVKKD